MAVSRRYWHASMRQVRFDQDRFMAEVDDILKWVFHRRNVDESLHWFDFSLQQKVYGSRVELNKCRVRRKFFGCPSNWLIISSTEYGCFAIKQSIDWQRRIVVRSVSVSSFVEKQIDDACAQELSIAADQSSACWTESILCIPSSQSILLPTSADPLYTGCQRAFGRNRRIRRRRRRRWGWRP